MLTGSKADPALSHPLKTRQRSAVGDSDRAGDVDPVHFKVEATDAGHAADARFEAVRSCLRDVNGVFHPFAGLEVGDDISTEDPDDVDVFVGPICAALIPRTEVARPNSLSAFIEIFGFEDTRYGSWRAGVWGPSLRLRRRL